MANEKQLAILKQGVEVWNKWGKHNPNIWNDLSKSDLVKVNLSGANISGAALGGALLVRTIIEKAKISRSSVYGISSVWDLRG
jgi:uncharacterized protein YjbI with pentapeptide repeats